VASAQGFGNGGTGTVEYNLFADRSTHGFYPFVSQQQLDDGALMGAIAQGNEAALSELYDRYSQLVVSVAYHLLGRRDAAEDVALETFMRVWEKAETYDATRGQVSTWLTRMARYRAIDVLRRESVRPEGDSVSWAEVNRPPATGHEATEQKAQLAWQQERVRLAVAELPEEQRAALALAYFRGLTHREIAETLDVPLGTIKGRIRAAMEKLRYALWDE
jgi:RNA polymerase sigma-70 factor (ECF subfamily)